MPDRAEDGAGPGTCHDGLDNGGDGATDGADTDCRLDLDVKQAYQTTSVDEARQILETYNVKYVYVGALERETYGEQGLAKFATFMNRAGCLRRAVTAYTAGKRKFLEKFAHPFLVLSFVRINL